MDGGGRGVRGSQRRRLVMAYFTWTLRQFGSNLTELWILNVFRFVFVSSRSRSLSCFPVFAFALSISRTHTQLTNGAMIDDVLNECGAVTLSNESAQHTHTHTNDPENSYAISIIWCDLIRSGIRSCPWQHVIDSATPFPTSYTPSSSTQLKHFSDKA